MTSSPRGPYGLQAAIASLQTQERLDWTQIAALYAELADRPGSPVVRLNQVLAGEPGDVKVVVDLTR
jgi:RNA polymerase sigma-70 factor (ECF subfamily)